MKHTAPILKKGPALWEKAKKCIPGGNQLLSKRSEMFLPKLWPSYYTKAHGIRVTDLDGNTFTDMSIMGIGACILGYADPDVNKAVKDAIDAGSASTLNSPEEVDCAELLLTLHPWAQMARFARSGGEAMAIAVRIARARSGKDAIAFCGYHGWHDWYLSANLASDKNLDGHLLPGLAPKGVPRGLLNTAFPFHYNKIEELEALVKKHKNIGVIVMEPFRSQPPENNFLENVRKIADRIGAVLIFDEITIGWRLNVGGAHLMLGVTPDIAVFGKAMSNGFPMAAIIGKRGVMQAAQQTFISSTQWTERIGPAASVATIKKLKQCNVPRHLRTIGEKIMTGLKQVSADCSLKITLHGPAAKPSFSFDYGAQSQHVKTLFTQEMLMRGFLAGNLIFVTYAHTKKHVEAYLAACEEVFHLIKKAVDQKKVKKLLQGPVAHSGFQRLI